MLHLQAEHGNRVHVGVPVVRLWWLLDGGPIQDSAGITVLVAPRLGRCCGAVHSAPVREAHVGRSATIHPLPARGYRNQQIGLTAPWGGVRSTFPPAGLLDLGDVLGRRQHSDEGGVLPKRDGLRAGYHPVAATRAGRVGMRKPDEKQRLPMFLRLLPQPSSVAFQQPRPMPVVVG